MYEDWVTIVHIIYLDVLDKEHLEVGGLYVKGCTGRNFNILLCQKL